MESHGKFQGGRGILKAKLEFPGGGGGCKTKKPSVGGGSMDIGKISTQLHTLIMYATISYSWWGTS